MAGLQDDDQAPSPRADDQEVAMNTIRTAALAGMAAATLGAGPAAQAQTGVSRTDLQRHDLSIPGRETVQVRVDFAPGAVAPRHSHHGEEIVYSIEGSLEYRLDGQPPVVLTPGKVLFIPTGAIHEVANVGAGPAAELATYVVEKGKPLVTLAE
jgi:quercetin dioxygenase-like cupin family protein